ncbi:hypothetical protein J6590_049394 [Homalodisca vitripennis]|nr:hypothetical protein J6590_049394 [Homalodisca vitripennis]
MDSSSIRYSVVRATTAMDSISYSVGKAATAMDTSSIRYSVDKNCHCHGQLTHQVAVIRATTAMYSSSISYSVGKLPLPWAPHPSGIRWIRLPCHGQLTHHLRYSVDKLHCHGQLTHQVCVTATTAMDSSHHQVFGGREMATAMDSSSIMYSVIRLPLPWTAHPSGIRWIEDATTMDSSSIRYSVDERCTYHGQLIHQVCGIRQLPLP